MARSRILSKFKQTQIQKFINAVESPVTAITIATGGAGYANGEALEFDSGTASGLVFTDNAGTITSVALTARGSYLSPPEITVDTTAGVGAVLSPVLENDYYYLFAGNANPWENELNPPDATENDFDAFYEAHLDMMFGKRVTKSDMAFMVRKRVWVSGTSYAIYDDKDPGIDQKPFYIITDDRNVYKCIENAAGAPSTAKPTHQVAGGLPPFETDGYRWKYLYTISEAAEAKFGTVNFIPVIANNSVTAAATPGELLHIQVESPGSNYPSATGTIARSVNTSLVELFGTLSEQPGYYSNCTISVFNSFTNEVINRVIVAYTANSSGKFVQVSPAFGVGDAANSSIFDIAPSVRVVGDGSNAVARAVMNLSTGSISRVDVIDSGSGYSRADVVVQTSAAFGSGAELRAIISPPGGHGANVFSELFSSHIALTADFSNTASVGFPSEVAYRTVGLLKNPEVFDLTNQLYSDSQFNQTTVILASNNSAASLENGETVVGNLSEARARVAFSNTSTIGVTGYEGRFANGEILTGERSGTQYTVQNAAAEPDIQLFSGDVLYLQNIQPIQRSNTSVEQIKLVVKL